MPGAFRRSAAVALMAGAALGATASPSAASVTIGQLDPGTPGSVCAVTPYDRAQPTVTSGTSYVVPSLPPATNLVISSWSQKARSGTNQVMTLKMFRKVGNPNTWQVAGHDGPHPLTSGQVNTFSSHVPVQPGDVLGLNPVGSATLTGCLFSVPGDQFLNRNGDLTDGQPGDFTPSAGYRLNITAVVSPENAFTLGKTATNKKKGNATLTVNLPNAGELTASGKGVKASGATTSKSVSAGAAKLPIKAKGKQKRKLDETGKVKLSVTVTYTPTGGEATTQSLKVKLKKLV